jgi:hypothetical protein
LGRLNPSVAYVGRHHLGCDSCYPAQLRKSIILQLGYGRWNFPIEITFSSSFGLIPRSETGAGAGGEFSLEARRVFKIFLDYEENKLRLVLREDGGEHLQMKDYESGQIK